MAPPYRASLRRLVSAFTIIATYLTTKTPGKNIPEAQLDGWSEGMDVVVRKVFPLHQKAFPPWRCLRGGAGAIYPKLNDTDLWEEARKPKTKDTKNKVPPWLDLESSTETTLSPDTFRERTPRLHAFIDYMAKKQDLPPGLVKEITRLTDTTQDEEVRRTAKTEIPKLLARHGMPIEEIMDMNIMDYRTEARINAFKESLYQTDRRSRGEFGKVTTHAGFKVEELVKMTPRQRYRRPFKNVNELRMALGLTVTPDHTVYIADAENNTIKRIPPQGGETYTIVGSKFQGRVIDGVGSTVNLRMPLDVVYVENGDIYVADSGHLAIRKISPDSNSSTVSEIYDYVALKPVELETISRDGPASRARFREVYGMCARGGYLYITDSNSYQIRKMRLSGDYEVTTIAGGKLYPNQDEGELEPEMSASAWRDGDAKNASFRHPIGVTVDSHGNVFVTDQPGLRTEEYHGIRKITPDGLVTTFAGLHQGFQDGVGTEARFDAPYGIVIDSDDVLYVTDTLNHAIRRIFPDRTVDTIVGNGTCGDTEGSPLRANFDEPRGIAITPDRTLYVSDAVNTKVKKISPYPTPREPAPEEELQKHDVVNYEPPKHVWESNMGRPCFTSHDVVF